MSDQKLLSGWNEQEDISVDKKKARKLIWRTRLAIARSVIFTIAALLFLYFLYMMFLSIFYHSSGQGAQFSRYVTTLVETHHTGIQVEKSPSGTTATRSPLLTQSTTLKLYTKVGNWEVSSGEVKATKRLFGKLTYELNVDRKYLNQNTEFIFAVPNDLIGNQAKVFPDGENEGVWQQLQHIGDGHVAQMAFSTVNGMEPQQLSERLAKYNLFIMQMPVYAGELTTIRDISYFGSGSNSGYVQFVPHLTLRPYVVYDEKGYFSASIGTLNGSDNIKRSKEQMIKDLEWLIAQGDYQIPESVRGAELDKKRLAYLQEHGIKVYGAVVTGPVRELEKLKNEKDFHQFQLGQIEVWNWISR